MRFNVEHLGCVITIVLMLGVGCGRDEPEPEPSFRVRLLTSAPVSGRWERAAERGLGRIAAELDADVRRLRADTELERRVLVDREGDLGVDLVFCVGSGFRRPCTHMPRAFPKRVLSFCPQGGEQGTFPASSF